MSGDEQDRVKADFLLELRRAESRHACLDEKYRSIIGKLHRAHYCLAGKDVKLTPDGESMELNYANPVGRELNTRELLDLPTTGEVVTLWKDLLDAQKAIDELRERERRLFC